MMNTDISGIPGVQHVTPVPEVAHKVKSGHKTGDPRAVEAGRKGGEAVRARYGSEFFAAIGRKGGLSTKERHGEDFFSAVGKRGGAIVKESRGREFYAAIGRKGGIAKRDNARKNQGEVEQ